MKINQYLLFYHPNKIISIYIYFFIIIVNLNISKSYLIFPIEYLPNENYKFYRDDIPENQEMIFQQIYYKNFITKINIGTPKKKHMFLIESNKNQYYISSKNPSKISDEESAEKKIDFFNLPYDELYDEDSSISYNENICKKSLQNIDHYNELCTAKDIMTFKNENRTFSKEFPIKIVRNHDENIPGILGLLINDSNFNSSRSLITELKSENLIEDYYWFFEFDEISPLDKKLKGRLIIGALPHLVFPEKYSIKNFRTKNNFYSPYKKTTWRMRLDKIYIDENIDLNINRADISLLYEFYNIIGTLEFHNIIKERFMNKLIEEKKCFKSNFSQNIYTNYNMTFYYCHKSAKDILYKNIPAIKMFSFDLSYIFELTKEELFYIKGDYIYFNIIFCTKEFNYWLMGQIFTTKYNFIFNTNKKQIGFYQKVNENFKNENINNNIKDKNSSLLIHVLIIVAIIFTCVGLFIGRRIFGLRRKIIVNELIEEQNYEYRTNSKINSNVLESSYKPIGNYKNKSIFEMTKKSNE